MTYRRGSNTRTEGSGWFLPRSLRSEGEQQSAPPPRPAKEARAKPVKGQPGVVYGPERVRDLKHGNDLVVGERTVVKQAAHYGVLRGMLWCVVLGALLFWLPVLGPALAGYVGGRKAGGPVRAVVAVAIPAAALLLGLAYLDATYGIVPSASTLPGDYDMGPLADIREVGSPIAAALTAAVEGWVAAPPDFFFVMGVFALAGGALSAMRRAEEETIIERLGIPLGEVKDRARAGEFGVEAQEAMQGPVWRRSSHPAVVGPVAAHDGMHELVEMIVEGVAERVGGPQRAVPTSRLIPRPGRRGIIHRGVASGPALEHMRAENGAYGYAEETPAAQGRPRGRSTGGRRDGVEAMEVWEEVPAVHSAVGWAKPPRRKATRPMRMGPGGSVVPRESRRARAARAAGGRTRLGWMSRRRTVAPAYTSTSDEGELQAAIEAISMDAVPAGASKAHRARKQPDHVSKRLPITSAILGIQDEGDGAEEEELGGPAGAEAEARAKAGRPEADYIPRVPRKTTFSHGAGGGVTVVAKSTMDETTEPPSVPPVRAPASLPATMPGPRPQASLRGRSRKMRPSAAEYEEEFAEPGMIVWTAKGGEEGTDYFQGRRGRTTAASATAATAGATSGSSPAPTEAGAAGQPDWEEERIAAMVREREEWDRL